MERKILLVDDSKPMLALLSGVFKSAYQVVSKENVREALSCLEEGEIPDLIITDINMPDIDGNEFVRQLKADGYFSQIPVIVLSGNESSSVKLSILRLGVDDYVGKPFNPEELYVRAERLLKRKSGSSRNAEA